VAADISNLVGGLEDLLRRTLGETISLQIESSSDLRPAMIDPHQFENALINLAVNSRDAMIGGGSLVIHTTNVTLDETYTEQQAEVSPVDYVKVSVSDTGTSTSSLNISNHVDQL
jgi:signal transduction histidine kinase